MFLPRFRFSRHVVALAGWPRRVAALLCLMLAVLSACHGRRAPVPEHRSTVMVATRQLSPGTVLTAAELGTTQWPDRLIPTSAIRAPAGALGRTVAAAMTRGEPFTAARLLDTGMAAALAPGQVALTIGLTGGNQAAILQAGALVDVYATGPDAGASTSTGRRVGTGLRVLAVLPASSDPPGSTGPSLVLAADRLTAGRLADAQPGQFLASLVPPS